MTVKITPNDKGNPPGKVAEAELHFTEGPLDGLKLIGFAIWEQRGGVGGYNVTFPARYALKSPGTPRMESRRKHSGSRKSSSTRR